MAKTAKKQAKPEFWRLWDTYPTKAEAQKMGKRLSKPFEIRKLGNEYGVYLK